MSEYYKWLPRTKAILGITLFCLGTGTSAQERLEKPHMTQSLKTLAKSTGAWQTLSTTPNMEHYDVTGYKLHFSFDINNAILYGYTEITINPLGWLDTLDFNFFSNMVVDSVTFADSFVQRDNDILTLFLTQPQPPQQVFTVGIAYHGHPVETGFQAFSFSSQGGYPMLSSLSEPYGARTWWPCKDTPTDKADSLDVWITVDSTLTGVSNGMLVEVTDTPGGLRTFHWQHRYPITTYLVFVSVTRYMTWQDTVELSDGTLLPLQYWMYPYYYNETNINRWNRTPTMIQVYDSLYGDYPFKEEKYGMAQFNWGGAMEHQTCSSMGSSSENTIAHELAHQWWGDLVTCANFHHIWLNEGFATYSEALYWGALYGESAYRAHMQNMDYAYTGSIYRQDTTDVWGIFDYIVYGKGAWVLHMLRHIVGDDNFFEALASYRQQYQFSHAVTEDFQDVVESVSGMDLDWFFDQWIYGSSRPEYRWWWAATAPDSGGNSVVTIHIDQVQGGIFPTFKMPIDFQIDDTLVTLWDSLRSQDFTLLLPFQPTSVQFDPGYWIHKQVQQVTDTQPSSQLPDSYRLTAAFPNPFNSTLTIVMENREPFQGYWRVFDLQGREVWSENFSMVLPGRHLFHWEALNKQKVPLPSGIYFIEFRDLSGRTEVLKALLIR
jgi:Aminopeptidase N